MNNVTYATKVWRGEWKEVIDRHPDAELVIGNNLGFRFVDIGDTTEKYYSPELEAVRQIKTKYILWYANDVIIPKTDWLKDAFPLLKKYPIVSCRGFGDNMPINEENGKLTEWGWEDYHFTDQCYLAETEYMRSIDYEVKHPIAKDYPFPDTFEARVGQWLAHNKTPMAFLKNHRYEHIDKRDKENG